MKRKLLLGLVVALFSAVGAWAQTDVTSTYLTNADFDTNPNVNKDGVNSEATTAYSNGTTIVYNVDGWTCDNKINNNAAFGGTFTYGSTGKNNNVTNVVCDKFGRKEGAALGLSSGWGDYPKYTQTITLPAGSYKITLDAINRSDSKTIEKNLFGWEPTDGDAIYAEQKNFEKDVWYTMSVTLKLDAVTEGKISVGLIGGTAGSGSTGKLFVDNVKIFKMDGGKPSIANPIDYSDLVNQTTWSVMQDDNETPTTSDKLVTNITGGDWTGRYVERYRGVAGHYGKALYQTVTVPAGVYQVQAACMSSSANNVDVEAGKKDGDLDVAYFYANKEELTYPLSDKKGYFRKQIVTLDAEGTIEFGINTKVVGANWNAIGCATVVKVANTYSEYVEDLLSESIAAWNQTHSALAALDATKLPDAAETAIATELAKERPNTQVELETAIAALQTLIDSYDAIKTSYDNVLALIQKTTSEKTNSTADSKTTIDNAISTATTDVENQTSVSGIDEVYATLEAARETYVQGAVPTTGYTLDFTFKIANAAVVNTDGWTNGRVGSGENYTGAPDNVYLDTWNDTRNQKQDITNLPMGIYTLKVATRAISGLGNGNIYVLKDGKNLNSEQVHKDGNTGGDLGNGWSWTEVKFSLFEASDVTIGFYAECNDNKWAGADNFSLVHTGITVSDKDAEALLTKANELDDVVYNATVKSTLATAKSTFENSKTLTNFTNLNIALGSAQASVGVYKKLDKAITNVEGWTSNKTTVTDPIRAKYTNGEYDDDVTADGIYDAYQAAEMAALAAASSTDYSSVILNRSFETGDLTCWSAESRSDMGVKSTSKEDYAITSGDATDGNYMFNSWGGSTENNVYQTIKKLPAGTYTLAAVLAGFKDEELVIAANETTDKVVVDGDKTVGYLTTVTFTLDATGDVVIKASNTKKAETSDASFIKADNFQLYLGNGIPGSAYKPNLFAAMEAVGCPKANIGSAAFQYSAAEVKKMTDAFAAAQLVYDNASATKTDVENAIEKLQADIKDVDLTLNAPADGQLFTISLASGKWDSKGRTFENEAVTYIAGGRNDMGGYNIQYSADANKNLAQAFTFTKVDGNNYKMSQIDAEGNVRYVSTGVPHGGNTAQIRTTTEADKALIVTVIPTATEGIWSLWNTEAKQYLGAQDEGFYTVNSHTNFAIKETTKPSITINTTEAGWGTVMLPFAVAELPSGVKAYTCAAAVENELTLVEVNALEANKPYIIEGAWKATLTGDAQGVKLNYTEGWLTGVYTDQPAPVGSYVLLNKNEKVAFYIVAEGKQPTVTANHAYLTIPAENSEEIKAFFLGGDANGIEILRNGENETMSNAAIYNMAGQRVSKAQKGIYIVNGKKNIIK